MEGSCRQNRRAGAARVKYFFSRRIRRDPQVWFRPTLWPCRHGCNERDHRSQGPLVHATGKGWVKEHKQGRHSTSLRRAPCHTIKNAERNCQQFPKLVSSKARAASRRQPRELSTTSPKRSATRVPSVGPHRLRHSLRQRAGLRPAPLATALARRRLPVATRRTSTTLLATYACRALIHDRSQLSHPHDDRLATRPVRVDS